jgi:hypothetical protein
VRFVRCLVWLAESAALLTLITLSLVALAATMTILTSSPYVAFTTPGGLIPGIADASPSSLNSPGSKTTSSSLAGSSTGTVYSIHCKTKRIETYDGCNTLVISDCDDGNKFEYTEMVRCDEDN